MVVAISVLGVPDSGEALVMIREVQSLFLMCLKSLSNHWGHLNILGILPLYKAEISALLCCFGENVFQK